MFLSYWQSHGGVSVLGFPITEEFTALSTDGRQYRQQYFERARLEYHPENAPPNNVLVGLLGVWSTGGRAFPKSAPPVPGAGGLYFATTGYTLGLFASAWNRGGGLSVFGYPISGELQETNSADGKLYTVQYFERNRLEYHPEFKGTPNEVMLGLLGVEYLAAQGCR